VSEVTLWTSGLLSKWGFNDGDMPDDVIDAWDEANSGSPWVRVDWHPILCRLVRERVLPALDQFVELVEIGTSHNPIRAQSVDGQDAERWWYKVSADEPELTPDVVMVPMPDVLAMIRESIA
jgi:hypothetical protein